MTQRTQSPTETPLAVAAEAGIALFAALAPLPAEADSSAAPDWITIFPRLGRIETRDRRSFDIDGATLVARFMSDALDLPVDVNHATDAAVFTGARADAVGWVRELRVEGDALMGRVEWLDEGRALLAARSYRYLSPSFHHDEAGRATWLKAVSLVTAPAIPRQPALAGAQNQQEKSMKAIAEKLGLDAAADESACLAALSTRLDATVPKPVHDETLARLSATTAELAALKAAGRKTKVDGVLEAALSARKITPAQRGHYASLCATDDGLASVEALIAAAPEIAPASGLDDKGIPQSGAASPAQLAARAQAHIAEMAAKGVTVTATEAVEHVARA